MDLVLGIEKGERKGRDVKCVKQDLHPGGSRCLLGATETSTDVVDVNFRVTQTQACKNVNPLFVYTPTSPLAPAPHAPPTGLHSAQYRRFNLITSE